MAAAQCETRMTPAGRPLPRRDLLALLLLAAVVRLLILASGSVSFHADEAVVGLMARHILDGARPTFFYGQAYMGSLDAWLIAGGFRLLGESVLTIRLVQTALYLAGLAVGYALLWRLSERRLLAAVGGLALALPTVNVMLYTTATLGGYNELLLLGHLTLLLAYEVAGRFPRSAWRWGLLGLVVGLGWWTHGLIVISALPAAAFILWRLWRLRTLRRSLPYLLLALAGLVIGSAPWWVFDLNSGGAAVATFLTNRQTGAFEGIGIPYVPPGERALGLLLVGVPALVGMRFPWSGSAFVVPVGGLVMVIYVAAVIRLLRGANPFLPGARALLLGMWALFALIFVASTFGADPTGRYFLPLALPLAALLGALVESLPRRTLALAAAALVLGYQTAGLMAAALTPPGYTTQFDAVSHIPNTHDAELIAFLEAHGLTRGYSSYWTAFRLAFLSGERLIYSAALPYKEDLSYNPADNRYPPYAEAVAQAENPAVITANLPPLDARLRRTWDESGTTYQTHSIGPFTIYHDFQPPLTAPPAW